MSVYSIDKLMAEARQLAAEYRRATGKTLPISGEIAINDAVRLLQLQLAGNDASGYDAYRQQDSGPCRIQVKGRVIFDSSKGGQRIGQLGLDQDWDHTVLVLMDDRYEPFEIYEADRSSIVDALNDGAGNRRGIMSVAKFKNISQLVWTREEGLA